MRTPFIPPPLSAPRHKILTLPNRGDLSVDERKEYILAVLCLQAKPPKAPKDKVPGSLSRFDDFVATHMTMAGALHSPSNLFAAHRYYLYIYEKALREECGYTGYQPVTSTSSRPPAPAQTTHTAPSWRTRISIAFITGIWGSRS